MRFQDMPYVRIDAKWAGEKYKELIARAKKAQSGPELFEIHKEYYKLSGDIETSITLAYIRRDVNTADEYYSRERDYYDEVGPVLQDFQNTYQKILYESPFRSYMEEQIGTVAFQNIGLRLKGFDEKLIPLMQEENQLISRYEKLTASAQIPFGSEVCNLPGLGKYMVDSDRQVRRAAWKALNDYFLSVTDEIDAIYDAMVKNRTKQAREMGYKNYEELSFYRLGRNGYDQAMVENFRSQIKTHFVPFAMRVNQQRKRRLQVDCLKCWDNNIYFHNGNPETVHGQAAIMGKCSEMFHEMSPETAAFIDFMTENELYDLETRKNKSLGGYMTFIPNFRSPFIFGNFNNTYDDVDCITHESGHAFQGFLMRDTKIREEAEYTMETAEVHSMSMEFFAYPWMDRFFGERQDDYRTMHMENSVIFIPYGCMVDEFQHIVYTHPELTPAERKETWKGLEKVYRPDMDYDGNPFFELGGFWQRQGHIFSNPFYYIDYCLAETCAMQFKADMDENYREAWDRYVKLCKESGRSTFTDLIQKTGLDSPFADGSIEKLVRKLEKKAIRAE